MAAASLPQYVVLKSKHNGKYLEYVKEEGKVRFSREDFRSPLSKFEVELAESDSQLVHLRSSYNNNKYLAAASQTSRWIVSEADKPEEDQSKWSCTLFQPIPSSGDFLFKHVKTGNYAVLMRMGAQNASNACLFAGWPTPDKDLCDVFTVIDWGSLVVLPRYVAFKGDNRNYLRGRILSNGKHHLQFSSLDIGDETVAHEVFQNPDGSIRLKSTNFGHFWRRHPYWILADSDDTSTNNTLFWPVRVDRNTVALRSLENDLFCKRLTASGISSCLKAVDPTISKFSQLQVTDLARSREIYNIEFDLTRARKYNEQVVVMGTGEASNTTNDAGPLDIKVSYGKPRSMSWNTDHSFSFGVKTKLVSKVPLIVDGKIELSPEITMLYEMGSVETPTDTFETVYNASVPPMTKAIVYAKGSTTMCDVPFSYNQTDTYIDGIQRTHTLDDGTYTGMNCFNLFYEVKFENINPTI